VKLVLVIPPCSFCFDRDAVWEVMTRWGCWASLCAECTSKHASGAEEPQLLRAGAAVEPLPTEAEAGAYVDAQEWKRAKPTFHGRPQPAHEYVLLWKSTDPWLQLRVVAMIRAHGEARRWGRKWHHYWTWGDYEYWAMPPRETILNRRRLDW
jgi:hypothetical protein